MAKAEIAAVLALAAALFIAIGDVIHVWTGPREGKPVERTIRFPAQVLSGHTPVVYVEGGGGCIALTHVAR